MQSIAEETPTTSSGSVLHVVNRLRQRSETFLQTSSRTSMRSDGPRTESVGRGGRAPVALKEAFASGVPIIATSCGGLPEVILPTQRVSLVPKGDAAALAQTIVAIGVT
jgi:glycosyltransferase involved in cell wall biosynthesis